MFHTLSERTLLRMHSDGIVGTFPDFTSSPSHQSCKIKMHMEHDTGNNSYRGRPEYAEINMSNGHFVQPKSQMFWPGVEIEAPKSTTNRSIHFTLYEY
jgi:hypothetical protein